MGRAGWKDRSQSSESADGSTESEQLTDGINPYENRHRRRCGRVGASAAYALMISGLASEIVLVDVNARRAEGEAMDMMHGAAFVRPVTVRAGGYADCAGAQIVGSPPAPRRSPARHGWNSCARTPRSSGT